MSTVLWANHLIEEKVHSDGADKWALFKFTDKLDRLCKDLGLRCFSELCDSTDLQVNLDQLVLPSGMESTDELMARSGVWFDSQEVVKILTDLIRKIEKDDIRFGLISNHQSEVLLELKESLAFAEQGVNLRARFNFSIIM